MKKKSVAELKSIAKDLRKKVVTMVYEAQSGHPGGSLRDCGVLFRNECRS